MAISPQFLDELRARVSLVEVIGRRVALRRAGREMTGLCPFHKEKTPSFTVSEEKGFYHCFGCGAHGSVIDFVMETENLPFPEAVERLAAEAGMEVPKASPEEAARAERAKGLYDVMEAATRFYEKSLRMPEGKAALDYLLKRGLSEDTISRFRLGFAPDNRGAVKAALARDNIDEAKMIEAGLIIQPEEKPDGPLRTSYDRFRGRVMFPITDSRERVVAFGGRLLKDDKDSNAPKYLNSPDTPLFRKGRLLYGLTAARAHAKTEPVVIVEGYTDVLSLHQAGFETAVAPLGTALTEDQIQLVWRFSRSPVLCFDGDPAGERAAARAAERALPILKPGLTLRFAFLPRGEDPDSLVKRLGPAAMTSVLDRALPLSGVIWRVEKRNHELETPEDRAWLEKRLRDQAYRIADETVRNHFLRDFKDRLWKEFRDGGPAGARGHQMAEKSGSSAKVDTEGMRERILLATLVTHPELFDEVGEELGEIAFSSADLDTFRQQVLKTLSDLPGLDFQGLQAHLDDTGYAAHLRGLLSRQVFDHASFARPDEPLEGARDGWQQVLRLFRRDQLLAEIRAVEERLGSSPNDADFQRLVELKRLQQVQESDRPADRPAQTAGKAGDKSSDAA